MSHPPVPARSPPQRRPQQQQPNQPRPPKVPPPPQAHSTSIVSRAPPPANARPSPTMQAAQGPSKPASIPPPPQVRSAPLPDALANRSLETAQQRAQPNTAVAAAQKSVAGPTTNGGAVIPPVTPQVNRRPPAPQSHQTGNNVVRTGTLPSIRRGPPLPLPQPQPRHQSYRSHGITAATTDSKAAFLDDFSAGVQSPPDIESFGADAGFGSARRLKRSYTTEHLEQQEE